MKQARENAAVFPVVRREGGIRRGLRRSMGFSLIEVTIAMAIFMTIGLMALALVRRDATAFNTQQAQSGMNVALRNAIAQIQIDMMNAGTGYYPSIYVPGSPIGVTISNSQNTNCYSGGLYTAGCFDTLYILQFSSASPAVPTGSVDTYANGSMTLTPASGAAMTAAQIAAAYTSAYNANTTATELMLITTGTSSITGQPQVMTVNLSAAPTSSGSNITVQYTKSSKGTSTTSCSGGTKACYCNKSEQYRIAYTGESAVCGTDAMTNAFGTNDYVLLLSVVKYSVDTTTDATNPRLVRTTPDGVASVIADRIISFKVGAMTWGQSRNVTNPVGDDATNYIYNPANYYVANDFSLIRSLRVSLIGRTKPDPTSYYKNGFDGGNYRVEALSTIINPRNLSMLDQ